MSSTPNYSLAPCAESRTLWTHHQVRRSSENPGDRENTPLNPALCRRKVLHPQQRHQQILEYRRRAQPRLVAVPGCHCQSPQDPMTSRRRRPRFQRNQALRCKSRKLSRDEAGARKAPLSRQMLLPQASLAVKPLKLRPLSAVLAGHAKARPARSRRQLLHRARLPKYLRARANAPSLISQMRPTLLQA